MTQEKNAALGIMLIIFAVLLLNSDVDPVKAPIVNSGKIIPNIESPSPVVESGINGLKECCTFTDSNGNEKVCFAVKGHDCSYCLSCL